MLNVVLIVGIALAALVAGVSGAWSPCGFAMIETFTPHLCGGRGRRNLGVALFAVGAIVASAALGWVLGLVGAGLPSSLTLSLLAVLALVGAMRDLGIMRIPLPQRRGQVPESWRRELPLVVWAPAYGIILGLGVLTFQVVSTFWVVAGACIAIGNPTTGAACFALFGLGRVLMVIIPPRLAETYAAGAIGIGVAMPVVRRVNGLVLLAVGVLAFGASPALGADGVGPIGTYLPSAEGATLAVTQGGGDGTQAVIVTGAGITATIAGASSPSVSGNRVAVVCVADTPPCGPVGGVAVVDWTTWTATPPESTDALPTYPLPIYPIIEGAIRPSLSGSRLAYVVSEGSRQALYLIDLNTGTRTRVTTVPATYDISGPSLSPTALAWARNAGSGSSVWVRNLARGSQRSIATSTPGTILITPSVYGNRIAWISQNGEVAARSKVVVAALGGGAQRTVATVVSRTDILWGTSLTASTVYTTRWNPFNATDLGTQPIGRVVQYAVR
ncbi:MAG: TolB family protein [Miltoncostaeaceae bacterium]